MTSSEPNYFPKSHLQTPSHQGLGLQYMNFERAQLSPYRHTHTHIHIFKSLQSHVTNVDAYFLSGRIIENFFFVFLCVFQVILFTENVLYLCL